jgi:two-component system sensor histidine kinase BaeS
MSFRLRVLAVVMLVAISATAATAWLTLRQASQQLTQSVQADRAQVEEVTTGLEEYGRQHGTWEGVPGLVLGLSQRTGQRIHLASESGGLVIVDTDHLNGGVSRPLGDVSALVDPRPRLTLPAQTKDPVRVTAQEIATYRAGMLFAACLTRAVIPVVVTQDNYGVPIFATDPGQPPLDAQIRARCEENAAEPGRDKTQDLARAQVCAAPNAEEALSSCLAQAFTDRISDIAPVPVRVSLGAHDQPRVLAPGPVLAAAVAVVVLALAVTVLLSRRVLRPIAILTAASQRLSQGDLRERVTVSGRDELAELARSFNRMADSLQRGEERQRRLVADVAHELRTPLANLRGYLEALKDGVIKPDTDLFASLHEEAVLQQRIVDDLQDLALAEAGSLAYHRADVDLADLLETCRTAHYAVAEADGVRLSVAAESVRVLADPDRLRQVIGNLVTNALRATPSGGSVTLSATRLGDVARLQVADTGTGIDQDALPNVFDRFWRADSARGRRTGGSGLGLAIARQIVTDHNGRIEVDSQVGVGTTFIITLPAAGSP